MKEARIYYRPKLNDDVIPSKIRVIDFDYITKAGTVSLTTEDGSKSDYYRYEVGFTVYSLLKNTTLQFWTYAYCKFSDCNNLEIASVLNGYMTIRKFISGKFNSVTTKWIIEFNLIS